MWQLPPGAGGGWELMPPRWPSEPGWGHAEVLLNL